MVKKVKRIWVHTCSLDHKHALQNYKARGMKVFKSENLNAYPSTAVLSKGGTFNFETISLDKILPKQ